MTTGQILERAGIEALNPMQQCMAETDADSIILLSPTGTGKTLAFAIRLVRALAPASTGRTQAVVIAPSRELVVQIHEVLRPLVAPLRAVALYGGHSVTDERNSLTTPPDVIIATPGRLLDHLDRGRLDLTHCAAVVLDEYDKSLELGFQDEMERVARHISRATLTMLTSATRLDALPAFMQMKRPQVYSFGEAGTPRARTRVARVCSPERDKLDTLSGLLRSLSRGRYLIFVNHRDAAERVYRRLTGDGVPAGLYHGGLDQQDRRHAVDMFANGTTPVLVSTDLGSRGLDIDDVTGIIHYHMPATPQAWTHRNGRTARMGASGQVYLITGPDEDLPPYATVDYEYRPTGHSDNPIVPMAVTMYIDRGRREKISRADILGYLTRQAGIPAGSVGIISLYDHHALVAVTPDCAATLPVAPAPVTLKGKRARLSRLTKKN